MQEFIIAKNYIVQLDDEDVERVKLAKPKFLVRKSPTGFSIARLSWKDIFKQNPDGTKIKIISKKIYQSLASFIMKTEGIIYDHIDRSPLNNQKKNLRPCNFSENGFNTSKQSFCSSKYKGVSWSNRDKKWRAQICFNRKKIWIGSFDSEIEAAKAFNEKAKEISKEFANLNEFSN